MSRDGLLWTMFQAVLSVDVEELLATGNVPVNVKPHLPQVGQRVGITGINALIISMHGCDACTYVRSIVKKSDGVGIFNQLHYIVCGVFEFLFKAQGWGTP